MCQMSDSSDTVTDCYGHGLAALRFFSYDLYLCLHTCVSVYVSTGRSMCIQICIYECITQSYLAAS